jgi:phosphatidylserine decarboxylase
MISIAKYGWREVALAFLLAAGMSVASWLARLPWLIAAWAVLFLYVLWFFRSPRRNIPAEAGLLVAPADGKITDITDLDTAEYLNAPAVRIGIFMNIFNVHVNRSPADGVVDYIRYRRGRKVNAMRPDAGQVNECNAIGLRGTAAGKVLVRQIAGLIARRIVCEPRLDRRLARGEIFGMIKFGSRVELILPRQAGLLIAARVGQRVRAGRDVLAKVSEVIAQSDSTAKCEKPSVEMNGDKQITVS